MKRRYLNESMTYAETQLRDSICTALGEEGHPTYADILRDHDLVIVDPSYMTEFGPRFVAAMSPHTGEIFLNPNVNDGDADHICFAIRHEILHFILNHLERTLWHIGELEGYSKEELEQMSVDEMEEKFGERAWRAGIQNIAGDYDEGNVGYTLRDKGTKDFDWKDGLVKTFKLGTEVFEGLLLEADRPELVGKPFEELFDIFEAEYLRDKKAWEDFIKDHPEDMQGGDGEDGNEGDDGEQDEIEYNIVDGNWNDSTRTFTPDKGKEVKNTTHSKDAVSGPIFRD